MFNKNIVKNVVLGIGSVLVGVYALRSYGYQKECSGYIKGCKVVLEAQTGNKTDEEKDKIIRDSKSVE